MEQSAADNKSNHFVLASNECCQDQAASRRLCSLSLASHNDEKIPHFNSLRGLSKGWHAMKLKTVYPRKPRGADPSPARSYKHKSHVLRLPVDDEDVNKFYQPAKFTLNDFIVQFSANEDVPVNVVEKSLYSPVTYSKLQKALEERCRPLRNTQLSTQQLQLPDDLPEVHHRVPHKQLLIEMTAVIREQLSKVVC